MAAVGAAISATRNAFAAIRRSCSLSSGKPAGVSGIVLEWLGAGWRRVQREIPVPTSPPASSPAETPGPVLAGASTHASHSQRDCSLVVLTRSHRLGVSAVVSRNVDGAWTTAIRLKDRLFHGRDAGHMARSVFLPSFSRLLSVISLLGSEERRDDSSSESYSRLPGT